jgi:hypothetical protein
LASHVDKVWAFEGIFAEHEGIKYEVAVLRRLVETKTMSEGTHVENSVMLTTMTHEALGLWYHTNWSEPRRRTRIS